VRVRLMLAAMPLAALAACSRSDPPPDAAVPPELIPSSSAEAAPVVSPLEVQQPGIDEPPARSQQTAARAATPRPAAPASLVPHTHDVNAPAGGAAEPTPLALDAPEPVAAGDVAAAGGGKPRPSLNEGPIRDPGARGVLIRGGVAGVDDDCALHAGRPPMTMDPPIVASRPDHDRVVLVNDRAPAGSSMDGTRTPPNPMGAGHPAGTGTTMTGRPLPNRGAASVGRGAPSRGGSMPRGIR
jgi:hypothetical protein